MVLGFHFNAMQTLTRDPILTTLESPLLNLLEVEAYLYKIYDEKEIDVLVWLLENSPALESMEVVVSRPPPREVGSDEKYIQLSQRIHDSKFKRLPAPRVSVSEM